VSAEPKDIGRKRAPVSPGLLTALRDCADTLDRALALKIGVMDSQSRVESVLREQRALIASVAASLRALA
jgi:hypothetical protein